jgi:hypothetical protein
MKLVMTSTIALLYPCHNFEKPLNPVLGETFQAYNPDGSFVYMEQVMHHPPISYFCMDGPNGSYSLSGYSNFAVKMSFNSITLEVGGFRQIKFADGTVIKWNN